MIKSLELAGAAKNIFNLLKETMKNGKTNLICSNTDLGPVNINHGILQLIVTITICSIPPAINVLHKMKQGYSFSKRNRKLNHLLFMDDLKLYGGS